MVPGGFILWLFNTGKEDWGYFTVCSCDVYGSDHQLGTASCCPLGLSWAALNLSLSTYTLIFHRAADHMPGFALTSLGSHTVTGTASA